MASSDMFKVSAVQAVAGQIAGPVADLDWLQAETIEASRQGARLVVWPECAYPAYFLRSAEHYRETASKRVAFSQLIERLGQIARKAGVHLVAGAVEERSDGNLSNTALLFSPAGQLLATYRKMFLWHFDRRYFLAGEKVAVVDTDIGRIGLMICADGRCPELAAIAARRGAQIICNPTAWVSWGRSAELLSNPQIEYFIPARAMENGCWILSANKVGVEADSIVYCGQSNLVNPAGQMVARLDSSNPGLLIAEVDLSARPAPPEQDDWPNILLQETATLPVTRSRALAQQQPPRPTKPTDSLVLAAVAGRLSELAPARTLADLAAQSVDVVIACEGAGVETESDQPGGRTASATASAWMQTGNRFGMMLCFADRAMPGHGVTRLRMAGGSVETFIPARAAMLEECEIFVARPRPDGTCPDIRLLRARAGENRIFVVAAAVDRACIIAPNGTVLADSLAGRAMAVVSRITPGDVSDKQMAPGTDVVAGRRPELYARQLNPGT